MALRTLAVAVLACALSVALCAGTPGLIQRQGFRDQNASPGWFYVQGRNGMLRRVEISRARVLYAPSVPAADRAKNPAQDLIPGAEVRVTAVQDGNGEWRASRVEILKISKPQNRLQAGSARAL